MIAAYLRQLATPAPMSDPPFVDWMCDPRTLVAALEAILCTKRMQRSLPGDASACASALLEIDAEQIASDARLARIWSLAYASAEDTARESHQQKALDLAANIAVVRGKHVLQQDGLDRALAALLLHAYTGEPGWVTQRFSELMDAAVGACDALAAASLLAYGAPQISAAPRARRDGWLDFFASMSPRSLPYGWLGRSAHPDTIVNHETAACVARLMLQGSG